MGWEGEMMMMMMMMMMDGWIDGFRVIHPFTTSLVKCKGEREYALRLWFLILFFW